MKQLSSLSHARDASRLGQVDHGGSIKVNPGVSLLVELQKCERNPGCANILFPVTPVRLVDASCPNKVGDLSFVFWQGLRCC